MVPGKGMIRYPDWLPDWFYAELCSETRTEKGWLNPSGSRNEAWDLLYYCIGLGLSQQINLEMIDWTNPPGWAKEWDHNDLIIAPEKTERFANKADADYGFGKFAQVLA
jgi:phage terminase large subunit GpA-like protein